MRHSRKPPASPSLLVTLSFPGRIWSFTFISSRAVITTGRVFTASRRKSSSRPFGTVTSRSIVCPTPCSFSTDPLHRKSVSPSLARTGCRYVSPLVPSTIA